MLGKRHWLVLASAEGPDVAAVKRLRELLKSYGLGTDAVQEAVIGGEPTAVESAWLGEGAHTPYLQVHNISANPEQCRLLFDAAVTARLLLGVEPGPPTAIICGGVLDPEDYFEDAGECCVVSSAEELHDCLHGAAERYRYARQA